MEVFREASEQEIAKQILEDCPYTTCAGKQLESKNERLRAFAIYVNKHTVLTSNAGVVLVNTCPEMLKERAVDALKEVK